LKQPTGAEQTNAHTQSIKSKTFSAGVLQERRLDMSRNVKTDNSRLLQ